MNALAAILTNPKAVLGFLGAILVLASVIIFTMMIPDSATSVFDALPHVFRGFLIFCGGVGLIIAAGK